MRIIVFLMLTTIFQTFAVDTYSQKTTLSLEITDTKLVNVFDEIEEKTEFYFLYNEKLVNTDREVSVSAKNKKISEILKDIFSGTDVNYTIEDRKIILVPEFLSSNTQQQLIITGKVIDVDGNALPGVNIVERGTTNGTVTGFDGNYTIEVASGQGVLEFSFIGYLTEEVSISGQNTINVTLVEDLVGLDEVVVIGYGAVKKSDLTGSVASIKSEELDYGTASSVSDKMGGKVSGVHVVQSNGKPGSGSTMRIRGSNSILGNNEPLFVVDGIPFANSMGNDINPADIESIEILKDASSTAIYGTRGANGVVLITTKQGKEGKTNVRFNSYYGFSNLAKKLDILNAEEIATVHSMAIDNGFSQLYDPDTIIGAGTDWQDELYRRAISQNYQLSVSGGTEKLKYYISGNYMDEEGIALNSGAKRYSLRTNLDTKVSDKFSIQTNVGVSHRLNYGDAQVRYALLSNPIYPLQDDATGDYTIYTQPGDKTGNPVGSALFNINENYLNKIIGNVNGSYQLLDGLVARVNFGAIITDGKTNIFNSPKTFEGVADTYASVESFTNVFWNNNTTLTYSDEFTNNHKINAVVGFTMEANRNEWVRATSSSFLTGFHEYHALSAGENFTASSALNENQLASFLSRINYNINDKYLLTVSGRYDGSSRFSSENQWAFFPSAALAWRMSNEDFLKNNSIIDNLKLRLSAGSSGEQAIGNYQTLSKLTDVGTVYAGDIYRTGYAPTSLGNLDLEWEKTNQVDLGIDLGILNNRVSLVTDIYYKLTNDLLYRKALPNSTGYSYVLSNIGSIENKGFEFSLITENFINEFKWQTNFNISVNRNKILDLGTNPDGTEITRIISPEGSVGKRVYLTDLTALIVGEPIGGAYGYVADGTYKTEEEIAAGPEADAGKQPGDLKFRDLDGNGVIDQEDRTMISDPNPDFSGGLINEFSYKGFDLRLFLQFVYGNEIFSYTKLDLSYLEGDYNNMSWALDAWSPENPDSDIPRAAWSTRDKAINTFFVEDGSYLRVKNLTLGYTLPTDRWNWKFSNIRLYVSMDNLITFTNYSGYNPDVSAFGTNSISSGFDDPNVYPLARTVLFGLDINF